MSEDLLQAAATPADTVPPPAGIDVPDKFRDPATGEIRIDALAKSYRELERRLSQRLGPPAADAAPEAMQRFREAMDIPSCPEDYAITPGHDLCCADQAVNARLHQAHFSRAQAQLVYDLAAEVVLPLIAEAAAQYEADRQREKLHAHFGGADQFRRVAGQLSAWGESNLPPPVFQALSTTHEGVLALLQMMRKGEPGLAAETQPPAPASEGELRQMMRDARYWRSRDPQFVQRVTEGFRKLAGM